MWTAVQTRTRVYMFAFDKENDDRVTEWKEMMKTFERPASASLEVAPCTRLDHSRSGGRAGWLAQSCGTVACGVSQPTLC
jgi:hypothetical protein